MKTYTNTRAVWAVVLLFFLLILPQWLPALTRASYGGAWNNPNNWTPNGVPVNGDNIVIAGTVTIDGYTVNLHNVTITIQSGGRLVFEEEIFRCGFFICGIDFGRLYLTGNSGIVVEAGGQISASPLLSIFSFININGQVVWYPLQGPVNGPAALPAGFLPVELSAFSGTPLTDGRVRLNWTTLSELQNEGFEIERSYEALDWATLAFVPGRGTTQARTDYEYIDQLPPGVEGIYYRLKQLDFDGGFAYSAVIHVTAQQPAFALKLYPNPTAEFLNVVSEAGRAIVVNAQGQPLLLHQLQRGTTSLPVAELPAGSYILRIEWENGQQISRPFIVAR